MLFRVEPHAASTPRVCVVRLYGALFFRAASKIGAIGLSLPSRTKAGVLEAHRLISMDNSGLYALAQLKRTLDRQRIKLLLCDFTEQPRNMIGRSGFEATLGTENILPDLDAALAMARGDDPTEAPGVTRETSPS